jgi:hypothetical protein
MSVFRSDDPAAIARFGDREGVLSCYVTVDPDQEAGRPWEMKLFDGLGAVVSSLRDHGDQDEEARVAALLTALEPKLMELASTSAPGRGRALFARVGNGEVRSLTTQVPLGDHVVVDESPYLRPLAEAYSVAGPAGVVAVTAHSVRVLEECFGNVAVLAELHYEPPGDGTGSGGGSDRDERDDYRRRRHEHLGRFVGDAAAQIGRFAELSGWEHLVVAGEPALTAALAGGLPESVRKCLVVVNRTMPEALSAARIAGLLSDDLRRARRTHQEELVSAALEAARGLSDTLALLNEGRVRHLLIDASVHWAGHRDVRGRLWADPERPAGAGLLRAEPDLAERMIELAYRTGARVTLLDPATAGPLSRSDGVAALLRW